MVGYGAGAWQVAQLEKYGMPFPDVDVGWGHCDTMPEGGQAGQGGTAGSENMGGSAGAPGSGGSAGMPVGGTAGEGGAGGEGGRDDSQSTEEQSDADNSPFANDSSAALCTQSPSLPQTLFLLLAMMLAPICTRRWRA